MMERYISAGKYYIIIELLPDSKINEDCTIGDPLWKMYRTNKAIVIAIIKKIDKGKAISKNSIKFNNQIYKISCTIKQDFKSIDKDPEQLSGIYYFSSKEAVINWELTKYINTFSGTHKKYNRDGQKLSVRTTTNGQLDGKYIAYFLDGSISIDSYYKNGLLEGEYKEYFPSSRIKIKAMYTNGQLSHDYKEYFENTQIKILCSYKNGQLHGIYREWDVNRNLLNQEYHY